MPQDVYSSSSDLSNLKGIWIYDQSVNYTPNTFVLDTVDGIMYMCVQNNGPSSTTVIPSSDNGTYWKQFINGIVDSGSNDNGYYTRFADGTAICYGLNKRWDNLIYSAGNDNYLVMSLPISFISPGLLLTSWSNTANGNLYILGQISSNGLTAHTSITYARLSFYTYNALTQSTEAGGNIPYANFLVVGRWK